MTGSNSRSDEIGGRVKSTIVEGNRERLREKLRGTGGSSKLSRSKKAFSPEGYRKMSEVDTKEWKVLEKVPRSVCVGFRE